MSNKIKIQFPQKKNKNLWLFCITEHYMTIDCADVGLYLLTQKYTV